MLLERIYDEDLAQASYLIGCQANGTPLLWTAVATSLSTRNWPRRTA